MSRYFVLIILFASTMFGADSIYTWGYGEIFSKVLTGVTIVSAESYLFQSAVAVGGLILMIKNTASGAGSSDISMSMLKYLFTITLIIGMFSASTKEYIVEDEITGQTFVHNNVPVGIGETFSLFTVLEKNLAKAFETAFATPNSVTYSKVGLGFTMAAPMNLGHATMVDSYTVRTFNDYMGNCVLSAMSAGEMSGDTITNSKNLKTDLKVTGYLSPVYSSSNPDGVDMQCQDVWDDIYTKMAAKLDDMEKVAAAKSMIPQSNFASGMQESTKLMFGIAQNSKDYLMQQTLINMTNSGLKAVALATGGDASALAYAQALAETNQRQTWVTTGILTQKNLPLMKAVMTILILGVFIMLVLLSVVYGEIGHIKMGFTLLFAMVLWTPLALLINSMFNIAIERVLPTITSGGLTLVNVSDVSDELKDYLAFLGYMAASIPVFAYSIASKSTHGFVSLFSGVGGASTSAAGGAASQTASGNISAGNAGIGKLSADDAYGRHEWMGNGWKSVSTGMHGSEVSRIANNSGEGSIKSDTAGYGGVTIDKNTGMATSVKDANFSANLTKGIESAYGETSQHQQQLAGAFSTAYGDNLVHNRSKGGTVIDTNTFTNNDSLTKDEKETLSKTTSGSIQKTFAEMEKNGHNFTFTGENGASVSGHAGIGTDGKWFGIKAGVDGSLSVSGKTADGKDFSTTLSGGEADAFMKSFQKNISEGIGSNESVSKAFAKQAQSTEGFADTNTVSLANNYVDSYNDSKALGELNSFTQKQGVSVTQDLMPAALNKFVDTATNENGIKLSEMRETRPEDAAGEGLRMMRDPKNAAMTLKAFEDASGQNLDVGKAENSQAVINGTKLEFGQRTPIIQDSINDTTLAVGKEIPKVITNTNQTPNDTTDMKNEVKDINATYSNEEKKLRGEAKKDMAKFQKENEVITEKAIDNKIANVEASVDNAEKKVGLLSAMKENPLVAGVAKTVGLGDDLNGILNKVPQGQSNTQQTTVQAPTNNITGNKVEPKVNTDALVKRLDKSEVIDHNILGDSEVKNWGAIEKLPVEQIKALKKFDDWSTTDDKRFDNIISTKSKPTGGQGGDILDGGSGTDTFQPPLPPVPTQIHEQIRQQAQQQVSNPQTFNEQPTLQRFESQNEATIKNDFSKSMMDKGVFEDSNGENVNYEKLAKLNQKDVDTYMKYFVKDANAQESQNFESQPEVKREPEQVRTVQNQRVEQPIQTLSTNEDKFDSQKAQDEIDGQRKQIKTITQAMKELKEREKED